MRRLCSRVRGALVIAAVAAFLIAVPAQAFAERTIGLSSGTFKFEVDAGGVVKGQIFVTNDGDEDIKALVYAADQDVNEAGDISYVVPNRGDINSLNRPSAWSSLTMPKDSKSLGNTPYIELKPGDRVPVDFEFRVPGNVPPGDHNVYLFFEMFDDPQTAGAQSQVSGRIGTRITIRVKGEVVERLEVRPFEVPAFVFGSEVRYSYLVRNLGNVDQRVTGRAMLLDRSGNEVVIQMPIEARLAYAQEGLEATGTLVAQRQLFGPMTVRAQVAPVDEEGAPLESGKDEIVLEREVWFIPMWLVMAVGLFLVLILGRIVWMLAVRAAGRQQARSAAAGTGRDTETPSDPQDTVV